MPAYMVIRCRISDRAAFAAYGQAAAALVARMGGRYLVRGGGNETLEEGLGPRDREAVNVISVWPSREAALAFWNSPEYAEIRKLREPCSTAEVALLEGLE
ncbi:MAG: DUF1330 domain-containing protein [Gammaproteobacteria bacterium]